MMPHHKQPLTQVALLEAGDFRVCLLNANMCMLEGRNRAGRGVRRLAPPGRGDRLLKGLPGYPESPLSVKAA
jgi:hypothetical protein